MRDEWEEQFSVPQIRSKPHPHIVKQMIEDSELIEMMKEVLIQEGRPCPFCHRKLKAENTEKEIR